MKSYQTLAVLLVVVGAFNWGLVGLVGFNLVNALFGSSAVLERVIYVLVGLSGVWLVYNHWMGLSPARKGKKK